jgi:hypothetical protein
MGIITAGLLLLLISGCSSLFLTFEDRSMTVDEIIELSKVKVGADVIIRQIETTHSKFRLDTADIIRLKNEGVEDDVIEYMIGTVFTPERFSWEYGYAPYDYWYYHYYYPSYYSFYDYYSYYSPFWGGLRGMPYYRTRSPYYYPVNVQTDYYRRRNLPYREDLLQRNLLRDRRNEESERKPAK